MKYRDLLLGFAVSALLVLSSTTARAQNNPTITLDETGRGQLQFPGAAPVPLPGVMLADPGPGGLAAALTYNLLNPPNLLAGDLILLEGNVVSEVIRFNAANPATGYPASVVFYSDNADGVDALADTGFPVGFYPLVLTLSEVGPEAGPNGFTYTPTPNQPGYMNGFGVTYVIISDPVPEPGTMTLGALGAIAGLVLARRRRAAAG